MMADIIEWLQIGAFWLFPVAVMVSLGLPIRAITVAKSSNELSKYNASLRLLWTTFVSLSLTIFVLLYWLLAYRHRVVISDWSALADIVPSTAVILTVYAIVVGILNGVGVYLNDKRFNRTSK